HRAAASRGAGQCPSGAGGSASDGGYLPARCGYLTSNAGRSERMRGRRSKLRSGGGQLVAHSSELPYPHGSSTSTTRPARYDFHTLYRNGSTEMPRMNAPTVEIMFSVVNPSIGR